MSKRSQKLVAIIGAGPAGSSCAIALCRAGFERVVLVDSSKSGKFHIGESISPDMNKLFRQLGLHEAFVAEGHEPCYGSCSYWGSDLRGYNDSIVSPFGHGWHLDRNAFNGFMTRQARSHGAQLLSETFFKSSQETQQGFALTLRSETQPNRVLDADFVVDASGPRGVFASERGSKKIEGVPLICLGLRFRAKGALNLPQLTHLESVENGWWYATRVPNEQLLVTLYSDAETVKQLNLQSLQVWIQLLQSTAQTSKWVRHLEPVDQGLMGFAAPSFCRDRTAGNRWLAIGDAASAFDPITSQGIIKSMTNGVRTAELVSQSLDGDPGIPLQFEREVREQYRAYQEMRAHFYQLERRWPESTFWKKMHRLDVWSSDATAGSLSDQ